MRILSLILCLAGMAAAQEVPTVPTAVPLPTSKVQMLDSLGKACVGCQVWFYAAGTTTPQDTYTNSFATVTNTNPVALDSSGRADIWIASKSYKVVLEKPPFVASHGTVQWTADNVSDNSFYYIDHLKSISDSQLLTYHLSGSPAGTVDRTVRDQLSQQIDVKMFGAKGDAVTDDTVALQAAINYASTHGGNLWLPAGQYRTSATLQISTQMKLRGDNQTAASPTYGTEIRYTGTGPIINIGSGGPGLIFRIEISNLRLNTTATLGGGNVYTTKSEAAIKITNLSEGWLDHIMIGDSFGGYSKFASGVYCNNCSNVRFDYVAPTSCDNAFNIDNGNVLHFRGGSPSGNTVDYHFGVVDYVTIRDQWMEWAQDAILVDNNNTKGFARLTNFEMDGTRIITGPTAPYVNPDCLRFQDNGAPMLVNALKISNSSCRIDNSAVAPFVINMSSTASSITGQLENNVWTLPTTATAAITSTSGNVRLWSTMQTYTTTTGVTVAGFKQTAGTGAVYYENKFNGAFFQHTIAQDQIVGSQKVTGNYPQISIEGTQGTSTGGTAGIMFYRNGTTAGTTAFIGQTNPATGGLVMSASNSPDGDIFIIPANLRSTFISGSFLGLPTATFAQLGTAANGTVTYCRDCVVGATKDTACVGSGSGATAIRSAGVWKCPF